MDYITNEITALGIIIILILIQIINKKAEKKFDENNFVLRPPKLLLFIGIIGVLFFGGLMLISVLHPDPEERFEFLVYIVLFIFFILSLYIVLYCFLWKLCIENEQIIYYPVFGQNRYFTFKCITKVKIKNNQVLKAYSGEEKLFSVYHTTVGFDILISRFKNEGIRFET